MKISEFFKKYPDNEPSFNGTNYLTILNIKGNISYSFTYYNDDGIFEPKIGKVVAFTETHPKDILNSL